MADQILAADLFGDKVLRFLHVPTTPYKGTTVEL
jgi:hypothetical protein